MKIFTLLPVNFFFILMRWTFCIGIIAFLIITLINVSLNYIYKNSILTNFNKIQYTRVALVPGASVSPNGTPSNVLAERLEKAIELYRTGKVSKLLLSGDNSKKHYDEVHAMKNYIASKVKSQDIFLDHLGLRTYDSLYRARYIFGAKEVIIVSQKAFLPRALFLADIIELPALGYVADSGKYKATIGVLLREFIARYLALYDSIIERKPKYLGKKISIDGNGQKTWKK